MPNHSTISLSLTISLGKQPHMPWHHRITDYSLSFDGHDIDHSTVKEGFTQFKEFINKSPFKANSEPLPIFYNINNPQPNTHSFAIKHTEPPQDSAAESRAIGRLLQELDTQHTSSKSPPNTIPTNLSTNTLSR